MGCWWRDLGAAAGLGVGGFAELGEKEHETEDASAGAQLKSPQLRSIVWSDLEMESRKWLIRSITLVFFFFSSIKPLSSVIWGTEADFFLACNSSSVEFLARMPLPLPSLLGSLFVLFKLGDEIVSWPFFLFGDLCVVVKTKWVSSEWLMYNRLEEKLIPPAMNISQTRFEAAALTFSSLRSSARPLRVR